MRLLVTGGAGFIGSNYINWHLKTYPRDYIVCLDKLTYAANLKSLEDLKNNGNFKFVQGDICNEIIVEECFDKYNFDVVINFAAESHVDNSIKGSASFFSSNVEGVRVLLDACVKFKTGHFHQVSSDEVYGDKSLQYDWRGFSELSPLNPSSPYAASKAAADLLCLAYSRTHGVNVTISRSSNNYGIFQHEEKLLPKIIQCVCKKKQVPIYGSGENKRDWLYVIDHCIGIDKIIKSDYVNQIYNLAAGTEISNLNFIKLVLSYLNTDERCLSFVKDRAGHDLRYPMDCEKIRTQLGWKPKYDFRKSLEKTVAWYKNQKAE